MPSSKVAPVPRLSAAVNIHLPSAAGTPHATQEPPGTPRRAHVAPGEPASIAKRVSQCASMAGVMKSALWLSMLDRVTQIISRTSADPMARPIQIHIVQNSLGASATQAAIASFCGMGKNHDELDFWVAPSGTFTRSQVLDMATGISRGHLAPTLAAIVSAQTEPLTPQDHDNYGKLSLLLTDLQIHSGFFYFDDAGSPDPSDVLQATRPAVVVMPMA